MFIQEFEKELLDCKDSACFEEIAGALGAPYVISGDITKLGSYYLINITLLDIIAGTSKHKVSDKAKNLDGILELLTPLAKKLAGTESGVIDEGLNINPRVVSFDTKLVTMNYGMKQIPKGSFMMGSNSGDSDESPIHEVTVDEFWMDSTEVTQGEYQRLMGKNPSKYRSRNNPVEKVNWWDAILYCNERSREAGLTPLYNESNGVLNWNATGFRLPTEAEWEYASRAGTTSKYSWGDTVNGEYGNGSEEYGWGHDGVDYSTAPVASYKPNGFGLYDMSGNVWEWCNDVYNSDYYSHSTSSNPRGASRGVVQVHRGGSWRDFPGRLRSANRGKLSSGKSKSYVGFRVLLANSSL